MVERVVVRSISPRIASGANGLDKLHPVQSVRRRAAVAEAQQRGVGGAGLGAGRIGIHDLLAERANMGNAFDRPGRRRLDLSRQVHIADLVCGGLRRGVGRAPILLQQFDRHGCGGAELVVGEPHVDMEFVAVVAIADIAIEAANVRLREIAEAVVVQSFERAIDRKVVDLLAPLRRALDAAERAAHGVDLGAMIVEAVLHLDGHGAA